jgi:hypothetical protein
MKITSKIHFWSAAVGLLLAASAPVNAVLIYQDSTAGSDLQTRFQMFNGVQYGDELVLAGTERQLQSFSLEYFGTGTANGAFSGNVEVRVALIVNNGVLSSGYATPGTVLYDSGFFAVAPTDRSTINFSQADFLAYTPGPIILPSTADITLVVEFRGLAGTDVVGVDTAGVDLYSPPTIGANFPDYWENTGSGWVLKHIVDPTDPTGLTYIPVNFGAEIDAIATSSVPETFNTFAGLLMGLGLLVGVHGIYRNKKSAMTRN